MIRIGTFIAAACFLVAVPVQAQQHGQHGQHGQQAQQHGQHGQQGEHEKHEGGCKHADEAAHRYAPKKMLHHSAMLQLTPQQVQRLEALQEQHHASCQERMQQIRTAEEAAEAALLQAQPDLAAFERGMRQAANLKVDCKVDMARTGQQAAALLTAEQRAHLSHMNHGGH
jgi:Spy/CpxP family protein refolding chaperone